MKKHIIHLILLLLITSCSTNKKALSIGEFKFKLPKKALEIKPEDLDTNSQINQEKIPTKYIYKIDDIYLGINDPYKGEIKKDFLENRKKVDDNRYKKNDFIEYHQYQSSLTKTNNNETYAMYEFKKNVGQYSFSVINKDNTQILGGTIVFENQSNYEEATKILNDFLKSVKF